MLCEVGLAQARGDWHADAGGAVLEREAQVLTPPCQCKRCVRNIKSTDQAILGRPFLICGVVAIQLRSDLIMVQGREAIKHHATNSTQVAERAFDELTFSVVPHASMVVPRHL